MDRWARGRMKKLVYLARYLRQPLDSLERRPLAELDLLFDLTCELVREENASPGSLTGKAEENTR